MKPAAHSFPENVSRAREDDVLAGALARLQRDSRASRHVVRDRLPEFDALRDAGVEIKNHVIANLDGYLERFEGAVTDRGGEVHWAETPADARAAVIEICQRYGAKTVAKGKSMVTEEIALNDAMAEAGLTPVETDLGEYILQLREETPSHIVMPAIHLTQDQIADTFRDHHTHLEADRPLDEARQITDEARAELREKFLAADIGITGANFLIAETGSIVLVTNEGNGDLSHSLPKVHIVIAGIEKVVPRLEDAMTFVRVLARSATGQEITTYTSLVTGAKRPDEPDGPEHFHVVLVDNGRTSLLDGQFRDVLRCIRCGACQSTCPVYGSVGGHAYGWVYAGPIGSVIAPAQLGIENAWHLPSASSFCGMCEEACPMRIPLPGLMRKWRDIAHAKRLTSGTSRAGIGLWAAVARRPALYRAMTRVAIGVLGMMGGRKGRFRSLPLAGGWTAGRDLPAPEGGTFMQQWKNR